MPDLVPVDHDPFAGGGQGQQAVANSQAQITTVDYDPFAAEKYVPPGLEDWTKQAAEKGVASLQQPSAHPDAWEARQERRAQRGLPREPGDKLHDFGGAYIAHVAQGIADMVSTPAKLMEPNPYKEGSEEWYAYNNDRERAMVNWAPSTALALTTGGMMAAEPGAAGIFGGRLSKVADHAAMAKAEQMEAVGATPDKIWAETGTARGADRRWRQEIDDSQAKMKINPSEIGRFAQLDDVLDHPVPFQAYPTLRNIQVRPLPAEDIAAGTKGDYIPGRIRLNPNLTAEEAKSTLLHEMQHAVQEKEGFAPGDNPDNHIPAALGPAQKQFEEVRANTHTEIAKSLNTNDLGIEYMKDLIRREKYGPESAKQEIPEPFVNVFQNILAKNPDVAERLGNLVQSEKLIDDAHKAAYSNYKKAMGEVESRNVQKRALPETDTSVHPRLTEDTPRFQQRDPRVQAGPRLIPVDHDPFAEGM